MDIWHSPVSLARLNETHIGTAVSHLGIEFTGFGADWLAARMPVDQRTFQPFGLLHGGASVLLAETLRQQSDIGQHAVLLRGPGNQCQPSQVGARRIRERPCNAYSSGAYQPCVGDSHIGSE